MRREMFLLTVRVVNSNIMSEGVRTMDYFWESGGPSMNQLDHSRQQIPQHRRGEYAEESEGLRIQFLLL